MKGVNVRHDPNPKRKKQWGVWVEVIVAGKEIRGARHYDTEAQARVAEAEACDEIAALRSAAEQDAQRRQALAVPELPPAPKGSTLFETLASRWLDEHVKEMCDPATYRGYKGHLDRDLFPIMRTWPVIDEVMSPQRLKDVLKVQLFQKGLKLGARIACQRCLSAFFGWSLGELSPGQLTRNPLLKQALYVRQATEKDVKLTQPPNPMTAKQAEAFLAWVEEHAATLYPFFLWLVDEGSRIGEACALQWEDSEIDLERGRAYIVATFSSSKRWMELQEGDERGLGEKNTKTHRTNQYIDLSDRVVEALVKLRAANLEQWLARGRRGKEPTHVFLTARLSPRRPDKTVYSAFHAACKALALVGQTGTPFTIHCLRDTFATLAILEGKPLGWVSMMLGHASQKTTEKHYYKWVRMVEENPLARRNRRG